MKQILQMKKIMFLGIAAIMTIFLIGCGGDKIDRLGQLFDDLNIPSNKRTNVIENFELPKFLGAGDGEGNFDHEITWASSDDTIISIGGLTDSGRAFTAIVTRPEADTNVTLTATIHLNKDGSTRDKPFIFQVLKSVDSPNTGDYQTTSEVKATTNTTAVNTRGVVTYINDIGLFIKDDSGSIFVYSANKPAFAVGDQVTISGVRATYNQMPQIGTPTITKVGTTTFNMTPQAMNFGSVMARPVTDLSFFASIIKIEGTIQKSTATNTPYIIEDFASTQVIGVNSYSITKAKDQLENLVGKYVELTAIVYDYSDYWRVLYVEDTATEKTPPTLDDTLKLSLTEDALIEQFDGSVTNRNITLPTTNVYGVTISWDSNHSAISNTGVYTAPESADQNVVFTVTLQSGTEQKVITITIKALKAVSAEDLYVIINQVYGGGGNSGATYTHDFIELYNPTDAPVSLSGWSVQYASATGTTWQITELSGTIPAKGYYLIQQAQGAGGTVPLPTPDAIGTIAMAATNGKVALVNSTTALTGTNPSSHSSVVDFVGYGTANGYEGSGAAPVLSNTTAAMRKNFMDTNNNAIDFEVVAPNPRNSSYSN